MHEEDPSSELVVVEAEVERVSANLAHLLNKAHVLKTRINQLYSPFIRLLPPELISEIFTSCLPMQALGEDITKMDTSVPLRLGAICTAWRTVAWSTPPLWATVILHITSALKIPKQESILGEWLSRSGHLPLSIRLGSSDDVPWTSAASPEGIMNIVGAHALRWRHIDVRLPSACYKFIPQADEKQCFPMLRELTLKPPGGQGDRIHRINISNSPRLTRLSLTCLYLRSIDFEWQVLTNLELESFYIDESLDMLRQTPNLVTFTVRRILGGDDRHALPETPIYLSALETVSITNDKGTDIQVLFDKIKTPSLRTLSYTGDGIMPSNDIIGLLARSDCLLDSLSISNCFIREEGLRILLNAVPSLKELSLTMPIPPTAAGTSSNYSPLTDEILQKCDPAYVRANQETCLVPNLEILSYSGVQVFTWAYLIQMIHSRTNRARLPGGRLKEVNLSVALFSEAQAAAVPSEKVLHQGRDIKLNLTKVLKIPEPSIAESSN